MPAIDQAQLNAVLQHYAEGHPKRATFTGDTFVLKHDRTSVGMRLVQILTLAVLALLAAGGVVLVIGGFIARDSVEWTPVLMGLLLIGLFVGILLLVINKEVQSQVIDLNTGDVITKSLFGQRRVANLSQVHSFYQHTLNVNHGAAAQRVITCQVQAMVDGREKTINLTTFNRPAGFDEFAPVMGALIQRFSTQQPHPAQFTPPHPHQP